MLRFILLILPQIFPSSADDIARIPPRCVVPSEKACYLEMRFVEDFKKFDSSQLTEEDRKFVQRYIDDFEESNHQYLTQHRNIEERALAAMGNPLARFRMVYRFDKMHPNLMRMNFSFWPFGTEYFFKYHRYKYEDLRPRSMAILLWCHSTGLNISELAAGNILNYATGTRLKAEHCYEIGIQARNFSMYTLSIEFLEVALDKAVEDRSICPVIVNTTLQDVILEHDKQWDNPNVTNEMRTYLYNSKLEALRRALPHRYKEIRVSQRWLMPYEDDIIKLPFWDVCSRGNLQPEEVKKTYFCWYDGKSQPYWVLSPQKIERHAGGGMDVLQLYDVLGQRRIDRLTGAGNGSVEVYYDENEQNELPSAWYLSRARFNYHEGFPEWGALRPILSPLEAQYIFGSDLTPKGGMTLSYYSAGDFGGFHWDSVASIMFVLEEAEMGGTTSFPLLGLSIQHVKGSALTWWANSKPGDPFDNAEGHSSCPVLKGRKCIFIVWYDVQTCPLKEEDDREHENRSFFPVQIKGLYSKPGP